MRILLPTFLSLFLFATKGNAQYEVERGLYNNSYVLSWSSEESNDSFEYLITDNPKCYVGCSGYTKLGEVTGGEVHFFPVFDARTYYWKVRSITKDTSEWSAAHSFEVGVNNEGDLQGKISIYPSYTDGDLITLRFKGLEFQGEDNVEIKIVDRNGSIVRMSTILDLNNALGFDVVEHKVNVGGLLEGVYVLTLNFSNSDLNQMVQFVKF